MAKDKRLYAKFDIGMDEHSKIMMLSDAAFRALIEGTMYSRRQLTDGFLDSRVVAKKWGHEVASELSSNSPERPSWEVVEGGYRIHDFAEHQTTNADIQAKRDAGRAGGLAKASKAVAPASHVLETASARGVSSDPHSSPMGESSEPHDALFDSSMSGSEAPSDGHTSAGTRGFLAPATKVLEQKASTTLAKTETETETRLNTRSKSAPQADEFQAFWDQYPRKVGKAAAQKAFTRALKLTTHAQIMQALTALEQDVRGKDPQYIPYPATWLNQGRWDDEPTPAQNTIGSAWTKEFHQ